MLFCLPRGLWGGVYCSISIVRNPKHRSTYYSSFHGMSFVEGGCWGWPYLGVGSGVFVLLNPKPYLFVLLFSFWGLVDSTEGLV